MCGLVGVFDPDGVPPGLVSRGLDALVHRGPDGRGEWRHRNGRVALGHVRLAFTDRVNGRQPIATAGGEVVAVVNGEHYDDAVERRRLEANGHRFSTLCDAELMPVLWASGGGESFDSWRGEFATLLWDERSGRLVGARDRFGAKPLFHAIQGRRLLVASEVKALFAMGVEPAWDMASTRYALSLQYTLPDRTMFAGVHVLPPGHLLEYDGHAMRVRPWSSLRENEGSGGRDPVGTLAGLLEEAVRVRLRGEREVGALLSGGIDSASVATLAARASDRPLRTFTVSFPDSAWDESRLAARQAQRIGAVHETVDARTQDLVDAFPKAVVAGEGLAINLHVAAKWLLFRAVRRAGVAAVLTGEGADELLLGYPHFKLDASGSSEALAAELDRVHFASRGVQLADGEGLDLGPVERAFGFVPSFLRAKASFGLRMRALLREPPSEDPAETFAGYYNSDRDAGDVPVARSARLWMQTALSTSILRTLGDAQEMAHGVEGRLPFLDPAVARFLLGLPADVRLRGDREKWLLREAMVGSVDEEILLRPKHPFMAPPSLLGRDGPGRAWLLDLFDSPAARAQPFFDAGRARYYIEGVDPDDARAAMVAEPVVIACASLVALQEGLVGRRRP